MVDRFVVATKLVSQRLDVFKRPVVQDLDHCTAPLVIDLDESTYCFIGSFDEEGTPVVGVCEAGDEAEFLHMRKVAREGALVDPEGAGDLGCSDSSVVTEPSKDQIRHTLEIRVDLSCAVCHPSASPSGKRDDLSLEVSQAIEPLVHCFPISTCPPAKAGSMPVSSSVVRNRFSRIISTVPKAIRVHGMA